MLYGILTQRGVIMKYLRSSLIVLALTLTGCANLKDYRVVERVLDGDTIQLKGGERVRFSCIDAPELSQPLGIMSRNILAEMLNQRDGLITLRELRRDKWGRIVGLVYVKDKNINVEMVNVGMAYGFPRFKWDCPVWEDIETAENIARQQGLGVWQSNFQRPWNYRQQQSSP